MTWRVVEVGSYQDAAAKAEAEIDRLASEVERLTEAIKEHQRIAPKRLKADHLPIGGEVYAVQSTRRDDKLYAALHHEDAA